MRSILFRAAAAALALSGMAGVAEANCTTLGFTVNDYGKVGPSNDAQALLDKYIARWATENKIKSYTTGKKVVTCELFLDFGLFDEYTCKADAKVCWGGPSTGAAKPPIPNVKSAASPKKT